MEEENLPSEYIENSENFPIVLSQWNQN